MSSKEYDTAVDAAADALRPDVRRLKKYSALEAELAAGGKVSPEMAQTLAYRAFRRCIIAETKVSALCLFLGVALTFASYMFAQRFGLHTVTITSGLIVFGAWRGCLALYYRYGIYK